MTLRTRLTTPLILLVVLAPLLFYAYLAPKIRHELNSQFTASNLTNIKALGEASEHYLTTHNTGELYALLERHKKFHPGWVKLELFNQHGNLIYPLSRSAEKAPQGAQVLRHEVRNSGQLIGVLEVMTDNRNIIQQKVSDLLFIFNLFMAALILSSIALVFFQNFFITRPLKRLSKAAAQISLGNFDTDISTSNRDEIGELARSFVKMRDNIKHYQSELIDELVKTRIIMDNIYDAIITADKHGVIYAANSATERIFGYRTEELLGKNLSLLMSEYSTG